ncbi:hypothetical protein Agsp01_11540 [Agromyces sp. NBRC 114283]|nr:hypothetical protein Agsp01_11540 [Agromyces sp. NBRC 114283]
MNDRQMLAEIAGRIAAAALVKCDECGDLYWSRMSNPVRVCSMCSGGVPEPDVEGSER